MTFNEYTQLLENVENTHELFSTWQDVKKVLKKFHGNPKFREICNFVEKRAVFVLNAMNEADKAIGTDEAKKARDEHEYELWCWKRDRQEPLTTVINQGYDPCSEICYSSLDNPDYVSLGMGVEAWV